MEHNVLRNLMRKSEDLMKAYHKSEDSKYPYMCVVPP